MELHGVSDGMEAGDEVSSPDGISDTSVVVGRHVEFWWRD